MWAKLLHTMLLGAMVGCARTSLPDAHTAWEHRALLVVMNETRDETLRDFPVLVRLDASRIDYGTVRPGGADLRFIDADGERLSHEVERWQPGGDSYVWLRMPLLEARTNHEVWMYYGNRAAESVEDPVDVWRNGYLAVYHFADASSALPSTSASNSGVEFGGAFLGPHASFNGNDAYLSVPEGFADFAEGVSIEAWVRPAAPTVFARITDFGNGEAVDNIVFYRWGTTDELTYEVHDPGYQFRKPGIIENGVWQYFAVSHAPDGVATLYKDGASVGDATGVPLPSHVTRTLNFIGRSNWATDELFRGDMDELRVSNVPRSATWLEAQHASMTGQMVELGLDH